MRMRVVVIVFVIVRLRSIVPLVFVLVFVRHIFPFRPLKNAHRRCGLASRVPGLVLTPEFSSLPLSALLPVACRLMPIA
jgi:hypothetical protein